MSDIVNRKLSDSEARSNTLTFRDVMLSMIQPSSESGSDVESNSDEDDFLIVQNANLTPGPSCSVEENNEEGIAEGDDTPPVPPPRRSKTNSSRRAFERSLDLDTCTDHTLGQEYQVTMETSDERKDVLTAEVDGVDIESIGNTAQQVSCIDQGEDTVILDLNGEVKETISDSSTEESPERKHSETNIEVESDIDDENLPSTETVSCVTGSSLKAADASFDDISTRLSQITESHPDPSDDYSWNQQTSPSNVEGGDAKDIEKDDNAKEIKMDDNAKEIKKGDAEEIKKDDNEEVPCQLHGGGAVSLTRVKCVVSMTTPRDARAHGATDCPSFVEFDMSVDGFGCLFLPAIAPQVSAGKICL